VGLGRHTAWRHRASRRGAATAAHRNTGRLLADRCRHTQRERGDGDPEPHAAGCGDPVRYDLSRGPIKLSAPVSTAYTSVSFYTRRGVAYYAINDRAAGRRVIELDLMTSAQRAQMPEDEDVTAADRLIVESPTPTGLIVIRVLAPEPGMMTTARNALNAARCQAPQ
jgi:uncharacterized membrane protein